MDSNKTGQFISTLRKEQGMTQLALADKLSVSNRAVSKWENGDGFPDVTILPELASALKVSVDELLAGERRAGTKPEPLFVNEDKLSEKEVVSAFRVMNNRRHERLMSASMCAMVIMGVITVCIFDLEQKISLITLLAISLLFLILVRQLLPVLVARLTTRDMLEMGDTETRVEFSDKIYISSPSKSNEISYSSVNAMHEKGDLLILRIGRGSYISLNKDKFTVGRADDFNEFIRGKIKPDKKEVRLKQLNLAFSVMCIAIAVSLIPLNIIMLSSRSQQYQPKEITATAEYFNENRAEFERALGVVNNDKEIQKDIKDYGYASCYAEDYIALDKICDVEAGREYVDFSTYSDKDCYSGYVYYEGNNLPYPYQIGFDHADIENKGFNYISEDDLYLLGKSKNDKSAQKDWYLIKILDDNWFYYEYY